MNYHFTRFILPVVLCSALVSIGAGCSQDNDANSAATPAANQPPVTNSTTNSNANTTIAPSNKATGFTLADVAAHDSAADCWMAIAGQVYDVTDYIATHPGGAQILRGCGQDATTLFQTQGGEGEHSSTAQTLLQQYLIGDLI